MKQKITVRALIREHGKILLLRRNQGREIILDKFELPGGELMRKEQPQDGLRRLIKQHINVDIEAVQLFDVLNFSDPQDETTDDLIILFLVSARTVNIAIQTSKYNKLIWQSMSDSQHDKLTDSTRMLLNLNTQRSTVHPTDLPHDGLIIYSDGGSRGNPGPSAAGFVIMDSHETPIVEGGAYLGVTTNNQAEYQAVYLGLDKAREYTKGVVNFRIDSLLVVNQMNGIYQIKNRELWPIHEKINELRSHFAKVVFTHVKREFNQHADSIVNRTLDQHAGEEAKTTV